MITELLEIPENESFNISDPLNLTYLSSEKCISLNRTNVRMSGNQKLVHKSDSEIYLESIGSSDYLNRSFFKGYKIDTYQGYLFNLKQFLSQCSNESMIYEISKEEELVSKEFSNQYPQLYKWGAYTEQSDILQDSTKLNNYRFFAPIWIYDTLPDRFLIFRVSNSELSTLEDYIRSAELIHSVSMKEDTQYGTYLRTLTEHPDFRDFSLYANFNDSEIQYKGISYKTGKFNHYTETNIDSFLANERTITEFNNAITNGWKRGNLICANLLNLEFSFNDPTAPIGFNNYVGFYTWDNEISKYEANKLEKKKNTIILNENDNEVIQYKTRNNKREELSVYNKVVSIVNATQLDKVLLNPIAEISLTYMPVVGSNIFIQYNNEIELQIYISEFMYRSDSISELLQKIAAIINETATPNIIITASVSDEKLIIKSEMVDEEYEKVLIILPQPFTIHKPIFYNGEVQEIPTLNMVTYSDIIISEINWKNANIAEVDGKEYDIIKSFRYNDLYVIRLNDFNNTTALKSPIIKIKQVTYPKYYIESIIKHTDFHTTMKESPYYNIWDYNMYEYQYKFGQQLIPIFERHSLDNISNDEKELIKAYREFFGFTETEPLYTNINDNLIIIRNEILRNYSNENVLIQSLDRASLMPDKTIRNEFQRLHEEVINEIRNVNILEPRVLKFVNTNGRDSYNNPISLNIDLPRRYDNFQYTQTNQSRSNRNHSHQWFIMGAGPAPYNTSTNKFHIYHDTIQKQLGYANVPIEDNIQHHSITLNQYNNHFDITNTETDIYEYLKYKLSNNKEHFYYEHGYSYMFKQYGSYNYNAIFRGVEYSITGNYDGYRFAVIMINELTTHNDSGNTSPYTLVDNREFKTLTLIVSFRITDKYITSGNNRYPYYLDRSFLYFTNRFYSSIQLGDLTSLEDFYTIDLKLFDNDTKHYYNNEEVFYTRKLDIERDAEDSNLTEHINSWYTIDNNNKPIFSIKLGNDSLNDGYSFKQLIKEKEDVDEIINFEWVITSIEDDNSVSTILRYTAYDIVEVNENEIWCRDIFIEFIPVIIKLYSDDNYKEQFIELTLQDIILNNKSTIVIGNRTYKIPFWDKIGSSQFIKLPTSSVLDDRYGVRLTKDFYEEIDETKFIYQTQILNSDYIKDTDSGKSFIYFGDIELFGDTNNEKSKLLNLENRNGYFIEQDQFWYTSIDLLKRKSSLISTPSEQVISTIERFTINNMQLVLDLYPINTIVVDKDEYIETTKKINILPLSETISLLSLDYSEESNTIIRSPNGLVSYGLLRQDGNYNPLFKTLLQPYTFRSSTPLSIYQKIEDIERPSIGQLLWVQKELKLYECIKYNGNDNPVLEVSKYHDDIIFLDSITDELDRKVPNRYLGQMIYEIQSQELYIFYKSINNLVNVKNINKEYRFCSIPINLNPNYSGRHIATTDSTFDNYCEEFMDNGLRHINNHKYWKAIYDGREFDIISDAALCEQKNFISSVYNNEQVRDYTLKVIGDTINLIDITISDFGKPFLKYLNKDNLNYEELLYSLKLYNRDLNKDNIIFENFYYELYKHHYEEWLHKHYKVSDVISSTGKRLEFNYINSSTIKIDSKKLDTTRIRIRFSKT